VFFLGCVRVCLIVCAVGKIAGTCRDDTPPSIAAFMLGLDVWKRRALALALRAFRGHLALGSDSSIHFFLDVM
jgi:hypothetical protein